MQKTGIGGPGTATWNSWSSSIPGESLMLKNKNPAVAENVIKGLKSAIIIAKKQTGAKKFRNVPDLDKTILAGSLIFLLWQPL